MKFGYEYRTSDNVHHVGSISAATRDAAFAALKAQGIRPGKVWEAPGFFNKLFGKGKRWLAISVLAALCLVLGAIVLFAPIAGSQQPTAIFDSPLRRQIVGDAAVIEKGIREGWASVFAEEGERFLASFAIPGVPAGLRNTTEDEIRAALERIVASEPNDTIEARQIKAIVGGMKDELRNFIAGDRHTIVEYGRRLVQRQEQEIGYYQRAKAEIENAKKRGMPELEFQRFWESQNERLRRIGVKLVPMPE